MTQLLLFVGILPPLLLTAYWLRPRYDRLLAASTAGSAATGSSPEIRIPDELRDQRLFPYSVIPGGVRTARELRAALARDPVAAAHYADFDASNAREIRLDRDYAVYVSYRLGDRIYWTSRRLTLLKGETVLTDGEHVARTRCGNRISETPQMPVSPRQPELVSLESPLPDPTPLPDLILTENLPAVVGPFLSPEPPPVGGGLIPPPWFPCCGLGGPGAPAVPVAPQPPPAPSVSTPEPGVFLLFACGLSALLMKGKRTRQ